MKYCILTKEDANSLQIKSKLREIIRIDYDDVNPDYVISIGGDGTFLKVIHSYYAKNPNIVLFGIHTGHLGFFSNYSSSEITLVADAINDGLFRYEEMQLLEYKVVAKDKTLEGLALNEVTIVNPPRILLLDVYIDSEILERYRGTGLCISTPYGSTAYNKSLHGAVVEPKMSSLQLTEIASINSNAYRSLSSSLVLDPKHVIKLKAVSPYTVWITQDNISYEVNDFKELECFYNGKTLKVAYSKEQSYLQRIKRTFIIE